MSIWDNHSLQKSFKPANQKDLHLKYTNTQTHRKLQLTERKSFSSSSALRSVQKENFYRPEQLWLWAPLVASTTNEANERHTIPNWEAWAISKNINEDEKILWNISAALKFSLWFVDDHNLVSSLDRIAYKLGFIYWLFKPLQHFLIVKYFGGGGVNCFIFISPLLFFRSNWSNCFRYVIHSPLKFQCH